MKLKAKILLAILLVLGVAVLDYEVYLGERAGLEAAGRATRIRSGSALPSNCDPAKGHIFFKTSAPIGVCNCVATDTWSCVLDRTLEIPFNITILDPTTGETNKAQLSFPNNVTIVEIGGSTLPTSSTVTINFDERATATPNTAGTNVLSAGLVLDDNTQTSCASGAPSAPCDVNTITNGTIAANAPLNLQITAVSGSPTATRIRGYYKID